MRQSHIRVPHERPEYECSALALPPPPTRLLVHVLEERPKPRNVSSPDHYFTIAAGFTFLDSTTLRITISCNHTGRCRRSNIEYIASAPTGTWAGRAVVSIQYTNRSRTFTASHIILRGNSTLLWNNCSKKAVLKLGRGDIGQIELEFRVYSQE